MQSGGVDGLGGATPPGAGPAADERDLDTPNCPACLSRMEAEESSGGGSYWVCTECGFVSLV